MTQPRLLIDASLSVGADIALDAGQSRHVAMVLRLGPGDALRLFNGVDGEWRAVIAEKTKRALVARVEEFLRRARPVPDFELIFAPVKRHATDLIVEKATELGAARLRPVITQRTIAETVRLDRLGAIAREAAAQCERFDAPEILAPLPLAQLLGAWDASRPLIFADEAGGDATAPLLQALQALRPPPLRGEGAGGGVGLSLLIGPEGGFTPQERAMLRALAFVVPASLGPRILRAETAVIAALSVIQAAWGDWRDV